jgi:hypothetical protein
MGNRIDLTGNRFGRLTVLSLVEAWQQSRWLVVCDCGQTKLVEGRSLRNGDIKSCGCLLREVARERAKTLNSSHGMYGTPTHTAWKKIKFRCSRPNARVALCDRWSTFDNFLTDMGERPDGMTLIRMDRKRGYEPGNCQWSPAT